MKNLNKGFVLDWKTFIVEMVKAVAWPLVFGIVAFQLKDKITELLPRLRKLKHKDTELEFAEGVDRLVRQQESADNVVTSEIKEKHTFLLKLADISPRSAVLEAFREIEISSDKVISKIPASHSAHGRGRISIQMHQQLERLSLSKVEINMFDELRMLRNKAAHDKDFNLHGMPVESYIYLSLNLANKIMTAGDAL